MRLAGKVAFITGTADGQGGTELTPFLAAHGRMFTGGHCESVGLGGLLLQGGQGWNCRRWGWGWGWGWENVAGTELPTEHSFSIGYGWAPSRPLPDMAFSLERNVYLATYAIWPDAEDDERHRACVHDHHARLASVGDGVYLGDSDFGRRPDRFMPPENLARLQAIRAQRDPDGLFAGGRWRDDDGTGRYARPHEPARRARRAPRQRRAGVPARARGDPRG